VPKVSVIIANYNHARFLRQRIDTVLSETFQDFEVILLDDASSDDSRAVIGPCPGDARVAEQLEKARRELRR
jgi:GT2 family glycosyltransferase